jgi:hypothetical protein
VADFETALADRRLKRGLVALGRDASHAERAMYILESTRRPGDLRETVGDMGSAEGMRLVLYTALLPYQPEITEKTVGEMISLNSVADMQAFIDLLGDFSAAAEESGEKAPAEDAGKVEGEPKNARKTRAA